VQLRVSTRTGWAMSLIGLAAAGMFAAWQSDQVPALLATGCDVAAVSWSYDVEAASDGSTHVVGMRFDEVPSGCAGDVAQVQFRRGGAVVGTRLVALGRQDVHTDLAVDGVDWVPLG
jgi:hypothetical protein